MSATRSAGVLDAAGEPDEARRRCRRPTGPAGRRWCAGRRTRWPRRPGGDAVRNAPTRSAVPRSNVTTPGIRRICADATAYDGSAGRPGHRTDGDVRVRRQQRRRPRRRSRSAGPAAGPGWPVTGARARRRTRPGSPPVASRQAAQPRRAAPGRPGGHVPEQQVGVAGQRLGAGGHARGRRRGRADAGPSGVAVVLSTATSAPAAWAAAASAGDVAHVQARVGRRLQQHQPDAVERRVRPGGRRQHHGHARARPARRGRKRADRVVAVGGQHDRSPGRRTASSSAVTAARPVAKARQSPPSSSPIAASSRRRVGLSGRPYPSSAGDRPGVRVEVVRARRTPARAGTARPAPASGSPAWTQRVAVAPVASDTAHSAFVSRLIRAVTATRGSTPSWQTRSTCSVIGISTPCARARSRIARQLLTPSAVCRVAACACSSVSPRPRCSPKVRLRDSGDEQVPTRSPRPASPAKVSGSAPSAHAQPGGLGQPAGDQRGLGVVAEAHRRSPCRRPARSRS